MFEFGVSMSKSQPVWDLIGTALPNTLITSGVTMCVIFPTAILIGTYQAVRHNRLSDASLSVGTLTLYSMPSFWLALVLQMLVVMYYQPFVDGFGLEGDLAFWLEMPISGKWMRSTKTTSHPGVVRSMSPGTYCCPVWRWGSRLRPEPPAT